VYILLKSPPPPWGGGKESKGLRAREENQRRVEKSVFPLSKMIFSNFFLILIEI
jgi:hypothetical protein